MEKRSDMNNGEEENVGQHGEQRDCSYIDVRRQAYVARRTGSAGMEATLRPLRNSPWRRARAERRNSVLMQEHLRTMPHPIEATNEEMMRVTEKESEGERIAGSISYLGHPLTKCARKRDKSGSPDGPAIFSPSIGNESKHGKPQ